MTKLIADIGGTNARFSIVDDAGTLHSTETLSCKDYKTPADAALYYLNNIANDLPKPDKGAFAVATALDGTDTVNMTNHVWSFSIMETQKEIGLSHLKIINDFTAVALAVPHLSKNDYYQVGAGQTLPKMPIGIIGPGTGLGVAGIVYDDDGNPVPITSEGGHVTMSASTMREYEIFDYLQREKYTHVSAERVCSGKGMLNLYHAIGALDGIDLPERRPSEITQAGLDKSCHVCVEILDLFCHFLGVVAGNLALSYGALGGIYIAGGIVPKLGDYFEQSRFIQGFVSKGRYVDYMKRIPVFVIIHDYPGLEGLKQAIK